jgi:hypothetical protein
VGSGDVKRQIPDSCKGNVRASGSVGAVYPAAGAGNNAERPRWLPPLTMPS